jgi:hypothetical protein
VKIGSGLVVVEEMKDKLAAMSLVCIMSTCR